MLSDRDGFQCIWAQRLDSAGRHIGDTRPVIHFHRASLSPSNAGMALFEMSIARDRIVLSLGERNGNVWTARLEE